MWPITRHTSSSRTPTITTEKTRVDTCTALRMSSTTIVGTTCYRLLNKKRRIANKTIDRNLSRKVRQATGRMSGLVTENKDRKNMSWTMVNSSTTDQQASLILDISHDFNDTHS